MEKEPNIQDVLDVMHTFAGNMEERFDKIDERFTKVDQSFIDLEKNLRLEIGTARDKAFDHADRKAEDAVIASGKKTNEHKDRDEKFKKELVASMKRNSLLNPQDLKQLEAAI